MFFFIFESLMMSATSLPTILLIRHAETQWNIEGRLQGWRDAPLTLNGFRQAIAVAENVRQTWAGLAQMEDVQYHCSDLGRARQTASVLADSWGIRFEKFIAEEQIKERNYGAWEGMTLDDVARSRPSEFQEHQADPWGYQVPGGEAKTALFDRISAWLDELPRNRPHVVVTHSGCFRAIRGAYVNASRAEIDAYREPQTTSFLLREGKANEIAMSPILADQYQLSKKALTVAI